MTTKQTLLTLAAVSFAGWLTGMLLWGPPGYSANYLAQYKNEHDHYLAIIKSEPYKRYEQRPHLNDPAAPGAPPNFAAELAFVEQYTSRPAFQEEQSRRHNFALFIETFNALLLTVGAILLARKPILAFLDAQIDRLRDSIDAARRAREEAAVRAAEAEDRYQNLDEATREIELEFSARLASETQTLQNIHETNKQQHAREIEDRKTLTQQRALLQAKRRLVELAVQETEQQCKAVTSARQAAWVDEFCAEVEKLA